MRTSRSAGGDTMPDDGTAAGARVTVTRAELP